MVTLIEPEIVGIDIDNNLNYHNIKIIDIIEYEKLYMDLDYTLPFNNELDE